MSFEKDWRVWVTDMVTYAQYARAHVRGFDRAAFEADLKTVHAVTRCIEIIGEAAGRVPDDVRRRAADVPWRQIIATRNVLAHGYGQVSLDILWGLVNDGRLEALEKDLAALLHSDGP